MIPNGCLNICRDENRWFCETLHCFCFWSACHAALPPTPCHGRVRTILGNSIAFLAAITPEIFLFEYSWLAATYTRYIPFTLGVPQRVCIAYCTENALGKPCIHRYARCCIPKYTESLLQELHQRLDWKWASIPRVAPPPGELAYCIGQRPDSFRLHASAFDLQSFRCPTCGSHQSVILVERFEVVSVCRGLVK